MNLEIPSPCRTLITIGTIIRNLHLASPKFIFTAIRSGFIVDSFNDASHVLENFMTGIYDLVILDVKMPEMDGFSLYEKIKKLDDKVVICFLTAADYAYYEISKKKHPSINENCVIHKPVDNESLLRQIKSILQR
jgi:DNA-binding response OmpR family regulator